MLTREKLSEALDIIDAVLAASRCSFPAKLVRCRGLLRSALDDFFVDEDDEAAIAEETVFIGREPPSPFPAA